MTLAFLALFLCASLLIWPEFVATTLDFSLAFYNQTGKSLVFLLSGFLITGGFVPALIALLLLLRARRNADPQTVLQSVLFFAAGLGFLIAYLHQAHGILYQAYPAAALFVLAAMGSLTFVQRERVRRAATAFFLAGVALYTYVSYAHSGVLWSDVKADPAKQYLMQDMRGKSVYVVAPLFEDGLPIGGLADWDWTSRYPGFWMVTLIEGVRENSLKAGNKDHVAQLNRILHDVRRASVEDLKKRKPDYIVCFQRESTEPCLLQAFLLKDPDFAAEFRYYRAHKSFPLISIYRRIGQ